MARSPQPYQGKRAETYPEGVHRIEEWLSRHPWRADCLLAALVLIVSGDQWRGDPAVEVVSVLLAVTVLGRRQYPEAAFGGAALIATLQVTLGLTTSGTPPVGALQPTASDVAVAVLLYTVAAHSSRRVSVAGLAYCLGLSVLAIVRWAPAHAGRPQGPLFAAAIGLSGTAVAAWVLGDSIAYRYRRASYASLEERAARLEAERDAQVRIAASAERARELQEQRAQAVDESAARLRQIERDLHDGAQIRLTALAMMLGEVKESLDASPGDEADRDRNRQLVAAAHRHAKQTLTELRDLARGIHPPSLDRGLGAALSALAETCPVPADLDVTTSSRPSPAIEAMTYFCAAELLANAVKHSGATLVAISLTDLDGGLQMAVRDDGCGGADFRPSGGLAGLVERVRTVDGRIGIDSPSGGPTVVTVSLPGHA
jgi:signal transduction histidine kinase